MPATSPLPAYRFPARAPGLLTLLRQGVSDVATIIPESILSEASYQLPAPGAPLVIADPALAREVLNDRSGAFVRDRFMRRLFRRTWGQGLAGAEGEAWQRQRRAAAPAFTPKAVAQNHRAFADAAGEVSAMLNSDAPVDLTGIAGQVIARIVFGVLVDGEGLVDRDAVARDMRGYVDRIADFGLSDYLPLPESWIDRLKGIPTDPAVRRIRALAEQIAGKRGTVQRQDMIALLQGVGPITDNIRGLFPAAMDTTVAGVSWTLYALALRPEWQERVVAEARQCSGDFTLAKLPITRSVVQEGMRLYPPAPMLARAARSPVKLGAHRLRKGQIVLISIYAMHRHRTLWDRPDEFLPERFADGNASYPGYMPFGVGPRFCIAAQFATAEIAAIVARLLMDWQLKPEGPVATLSLRATLRSTNGLNVVIERRP